MSPHFRLTGVATLKIGRSLDGLSIASRMKRVLWKGTLVRISFGGTIPAAMLLLSLSSVPVSAATKVAVYPGSRVDTAYMTKNNTAQSVKAQQAMGVVTTVYTTADGYDKVYSFYQSRYKPDDSTLQAIVTAMKSHPQPGMAIPRAIFEVDGPSTGSGSMVTLAPFAGRMLISIAQHK